MISDTAVAHGNPAHWTKHCVCVTASTPATLSASKPDCAAFNRLLAVRVYFSHDGKAASKLG